jgi:hypothetical protein
MNTSESEIRKLDYLGMVAPVDECESLSLGFNNIRWGLEVARGTEDLRMTRQSKSRSRGVSEGNAGMAL